MALNGQLKSQQQSKNAHTLTWNQASCVHSRISHAVIKSTPVKKTQWNDNIYIWLQRIVFLSIWWSNKLLVEKITLIVQSWGGLSWMNELYELLVSVSLHHSTSYFWGHLSKRPTKVWLGRTFLCNNCSMLIGHCWSYFFCICNSPLKQWWCLKQRHCMLNFKSNKSIIPELKPFNVCHNYSKL